MFYFLKTVLFEIEDDVQNYENELWTPSWEMIEMKMIKCKAQNKKKKQFSIRVQLL